MSFFGNIFSSFTLRDQNAFLQTKLTETQKELASLKEKSSPFETENSQLKTRIAELEQENNRHNRQIAAQNESNNLTDEDMQILGAFAKENRKLALHEIESALQISSIQVKYSLERLENFDYVNKLSHNYGFELTTYELTQKGRKFIIENKLI